MADQADRIIVQCACGAKLRVKGDIVGRKVRCPKCKETFRVEDPDAVHTEADGSGEGDFGMMEELAAQADVAPPATPSQPMITCPNCMVKMPADSRMCMSCGYDTTTGKVRKGTSAKSADRAAKARRLAGGAGRLAMGTVLSGIGALVGAGIWATVSLMAQLEIGYIAIGVGFLAGFGMRLGRSGGSVKGGVIAAGMALAGIMIAKVIVFGVLVYGAVTGDTNDLETQRAYVAGCMVEEALDRREIWSEAERYDEYDQEWDRAYAAAEKLSDEAVRKRWQHYRDADDEAVKGEQVEELAWHHSALRAESAGLSHVDDQRSELFKEEAARFEAMTSEQLELEIANMEAWEEGERWSDEAYVRNFLIYERTGEPLGQWYEENETPYDDEAELDEEDIVEMPEEVWKEIHTKATAEVDAMTPDARLTEARKIEADRERSMEEFLSNLEDNGYEEEELGWGLRELLLGFGATMFGFLDLLFIAFALSTAYKVALGSDD